MTAATRRPVPLPFKNRIRFLGAASLVFLALCLAALEYLEPIELAGGLPPSLFTAMVTAGAGLAGAAILVRRTLLERATRNTEIGERLGGALTGYLLGFAFCDLVGVIGLIGGLVGGPPLLASGLILGAASLSLLLWPRGREIDSWGRSPGD